MPTVSVNRKQKLIAFAAAFAFCAALLAAMCVLSGVSPMNYPYRSYLLQAQAWLRGETALDRNYEYLELALYNGRYYVSFPPVPSIPMLLWTLIFGDGVPAGIFQMLCALSACLLILSELTRVKKISAAQCVLWSVLICFGSAFLPIAFIAAVWYEAQALAFLCAVSAVIAVRRDHPTLGCICYALSVGCRPLCACMGPALLTVYLNAARSGAVPVKRALQRLLPGVLCGLAIAAVYGWYNCIRFDNPLEFGHNHLPEFVRSENGQFSVKYVWENLKTVFFRMPLASDDGGLRFEEFGFSMFLSCPILLVQTVWFAQDLLRRKMTPAKRTLLICGCAHLLFLLTHRTVGGHQFGFRYAVELIPYALAWLLESEDRQKMTAWEAALLGFGLVFNFVGGIIVHV